MSTQPSIGSIPIVYLLFLLFMLIAILGVVWLALGRSGRRPPSETQDGSRLRRSLLRTVRLAGFAAAVFVVVMFSLMVFGAYISVPEETAPAPQRVEFPADMPFEVEEVTFTGGDDPTGGTVHLAGWYVPSKNGSVIILLHGYGGTRLHMMPHARALVAAGYGVLMYDERASGESSGSRRSYGWEDAPDVGGAIAFLRGRAEPQFAHLGIAGCSIGGQIALQSAARYTEVEAVWADGPATLRWQDMPRPKHWLVWLFYPSQIIVDWMYTLRLDIDAPPPLIAQLPRIAPRPILLVGGGIERPYFGSEAPVMQRYAQAAGLNAQVWIIPEAFHCDGPERRPQEYAQKLVEFFHTALNR